MIIITGMPRTGSTSMADAMRILGLRVLHACPYTNGKNLNQCIDDYFFPEKSDYEAVVCNHFLTFDYPILDNKKIILLTRRESEYILSAESIGIPKDDIQKALMNERRMLKVLGGHNDYLVFNVKDGWGPLCEFLGKPVPDADFPHVNKGPENWQI